MAFPASFFDVPVAPLPLRNDDTRNVLRPNPNPVTNQIAAQANPNLSPHLSLSAAAQKTTPSTASKSFSELFTQPPTTPTSPNPNPTLNHNTVINLSAMQTGNYKGVPSVKLPKEVIDAFAQPFKYSLVGKFCHGRPSMEDTRISFAKFNLKGRYKIGQLDNRHLLIQLSTEEDYQRMFMKDVWYVNRFPMRTLAWSPSWRPEKESPVVPVWIGFPGLPIHLFNKAFLFTAASMIGTPLSLDKATAELSRPSLAKILIQVDILKKLPTEIYIDCGDAYSSFHQKVEYDNIPKYCKHCSMFGHDLAVCKRVNPISGPEDKPSKVYVPKNHGAAKLVGVQSNGSSSGVKVNGISSDVEVIDVDGKTNVQVKAATTIKIPTMAKRGQPLPDVVQKALVKACGDAVNNSGHSEEMVRARVDEYKVQHQNTIKEDIVVEAINVAFQEEDINMVKGLNLSPRGPSSTSFVTEQAGSTPFAGLKPMHADDEGFITVASRKSRSKSSSPPS